MIDPVKDLAAAKALYGAVVQQAAQDVGGGKLVASPTDPEGNVIGLVQVP